MSVGQGIFVIRYGRLVTVPAQRDVIILKDRNDSASFTLFPKEEFLLQLCCLTSLSNSKYAEAARKHAC